MAFKLTAAERNSHSLLIDQLSNATEALVAAVTETTVTEYNTAIAECEEFRDLVADRLREEFDGKSEKWQESDAGEAADEMASTWEDFSLDEYEPDESGKVSESEEDDLRSVLEDFTNLQDAAAV